MKMKKTYLTILLTACIVSTYAQTEKLAGFETCATEQYTQYLKKTDPGFEQRRASYEKQVQNFLMQNPTGRKNDMRGVITIPTVVHIVWNTAAQNVSDSVVEKLIQMLNEDYGRTNADTTDTPAIWKPLSANLGIQFCLAQRDPNGAPTNGIERRQTSVTSFGPDTKVKSYATGGMDAWSVTQYFNIWICDITGTIGGYGELPTTTASSSYGNVTDYTYMNAYVVTHECGHNFNLQHSWGDDGTSCSGSDLVTDTPNQAGPTPSTCPAFPATDACSPSAPGYMFMNYMDYGSLVCKNMFTLGQAARANTTLSIAPYNALATSQGCVPVTLVADDAGATLISNPSGSICTANFTPEITLRNWGNNNLTSCTVNYQFDSNPVQTYSWTGNLTSLATATVTLSPITTTAGTHTFTCYTSQPNGTADGNTGNDSKTSVFNIIPTGQTTPLTEGIENAVFPPAGWTLENQDASTTWARTTAAAKTGTASMWFDSKNYTCNGCVDILQTPNLDLTSIANPLVTFQVAYQLLTNPAASQNWSDTLNVDISTDCGKNWTPLYHKYSTALTTITPVFSSTAFVPGPNDWRQDSVDLSTYAANSNVLLRWKVTSDYENNLYIDDINISAAGSSSVHNETDLSSLISVYPNPTSGNLNIAVNSAGNTTAEISIYNIIGTAVYDKTLSAGEKKNILLDLSAQASGIYILKIKTPEGVGTKKIVINK
jgi:hypothetical protein